MVTAVSSPSRASELITAAQTRRLTVGVTAAGISTFALLYAPQPVLPEIAHTYGLDAGSASLTVSVGTAGLAAAVLPVAALSEVIGRRKIIMTSLIMSVAIGLIIPFAPTYTTLLVLRALQGVAVAGFPGVAAAFLAECLGAAGVAGAVGAMVAGNVVGGLLGRMASGLTTDALGWQTAVLLSAIAATICAAFGMYALRDSGVYQHKRSGPARLKSGFADAVRNPVLLAQYAVALLGMGAFVALYNAGTFRLTGAPLNLPASLASLVFLAYAMGAVSSSAAGWLVARFGRARSTVAALLVTVGGAALTLSDGLAVVIVGFVLLTGGFFCAHALASGWTAAAASPSGRGQASGLYTLAYYVGGSVGGTVGSIVYDDAGWGVLIAMVAVWLGVAASGVAYVGAKRGARRPADPDRQATSRA